MAAEFSAVHWPGWINKQTRRAIVDGMGRSGGPVSVRSEVRPISLKHYDNELDPSLYLFSAPQLVTLLRTR